MNAKTLAPNAVSALRLAALPFFIYIYSAANLAACLGLLVFCVATDFFDGYLARRLCVSTKAGAYFDASTDFALMMGIYMYFTYLEFYPVWLVGLIALSFTQFIVTGFYAKKLYDPVGKYIGSALYIGVALTLLAPTEPTFLFVQYAFLAFTLVSLGSRIVSLMRKPAKP